MKHIKLFEDLFETLSKEDREYLEAELQRLSRIAYAPYNNTLNKTHFMLARKEALEKIKEIKKQLKNSSNRN